MKKNSKKKAEPKTPLFVLKIDAYGFKQGQIFEYISEVDLPNLHKIWILVADEDFHPVPHSEYPQRQTFYVPIYLLEPIGYL